MAAFSINQRFNKVFALATVLGILVIYNTKVFSQVAFNKHYDNDSTLDAAFCVFQTSDLGYVVGGNAYNPFAGWEGAFLVRTDCNGDTIWKKVFDLSDSTGGAGFMSGMQVADGSFILFGYLQDAILLKPDLFLCKISILGEIIWIRTYGGNLVEGAYFAKQTNDKGFILGGRTDSFTNGQNDVYLVKTDSLGNLQWQQHYGGAGNDVGYSIDFTKDGGYIIGGTTNGYGLGGDDLYMIKVDSAGNFQWQKTFGTIGDDYSETVITTLDGGYAMSGSVADAWGSTDGYLVKTDSAGIIQWQQTYGRSSVFEYTDYVVQLLDSSYALSAGFWGGSTWKYQGWLLKTNKYGDSLWSKTYGNSGVSDYIYDMCKTYDGGYAKLLKIHYI